MNLALFDFDGTLTDRDSLPWFIGHAVGWPRALLGGVCLAPRLVGYLAGLISNHSAKERVFRHFFRNTPEETFAVFAQSFAQKVIPGLIRPTAEARLAWHLASGHRVIVISASVEAYLRPWCESRGLELIATRLEIQAGRVTGNLGSPNCFGPEKVRRLREVLDPAAFSRIYAYGDSRGDREMLALAHEPFYRCFPPPPSSPEKVAAGA